MDTEKKQFMHTTGNILGKGVLSLGIVAVGMALMVGSIHVFAAGAPPLTQSLNPAGAGLYGETNPTASPPAAPTVGAIVAQIIAVFFGLLGIIFVVLMVYGGFQWMTAAGNPDQVKKAQKLMLDAVVGVLVLMAASFISYWVLYTISTKIVQ